MAHAEILHQATGLTIKRNAKNRMIVVTLHYTADPRKRSDAWKAEARAGMRPGAFEKEYEISYTALFGQKAFPELTAKRSLIVVKPPYPRFPDNQVYYAGLDYGKRNPSAFTVYARHDMVDYAVWGLYEPAPDINIFAKRMRECPYWDKIRYIFADPHIGHANTSHNQGVACSISMHFISAGIKNLVFNDQHSTAAGALMWETGLHSAWEPEEDVRFRIFDCCPDLIKEFQDALYKSQSDRQLLTANFHEGLVDHNNHGLDADKYYKLAMPLTKVVESGKPGSKGKLGGVMCRW